MSSVIFLAGGAAMAGSATTRASRATASFMAASGVTASLDTRWAAAVRCLDPGVRGDDGGRACGPLATSVGPAGGHGEHQRGAVMLGPAHDDGAALRHRHQ